MPFDEHDDDDRPVGGMPLPPEDRLWRHPSELGASAAGPAGASAAATTEATATRDGHPPRVWAIALVGGLIGSALSLGVVAAAGGWSTHVVEKPVTERVAVRPIAELSAASSSGQSVIAISKSVSPAITHIEGDVNGAHVVASGIVIRDDGYVVTNGHLVRGMSNARVVLADGTELAGRIVGIDDVTDVAVVKVDHDHLAVALLGSATALESGQTAIAIGSPLASAGGPTVTVGVISAIGRRISGHDGTELHDMIQTDSPLATGSAGGALCDGSGAVIGMATEVAPDPSSAGLGFAIPVDIVRAIADDLIASGSARHPWLGVEGTDLDAANGKAMGVTSGARVTRVVDDSPASIAGVQPDDVITAIDGVKIGSMASFVVALRGHHPGDAVTIEVVRNGEAQPVELSITLGERNHA